MNQSKTFIFGATHPIEDLGDGIKRQLMGLNQQILMAKVWFETNAIGYLHTHYHSQVSYVESGEFEAFWLLLEELQSAGVSIAFDPNYRPQLWENADVAKANIEKAFEIADWLLPGVDDFDKLYGMNDVEECIQFCMQFKPSELVMKQGEQTVHILTEAGRESIPVVANDNVVDTTSAGDAFNGVYLGARASGFDIRSSALAASSAASKVIETPGAIMPKDLFDQFWNEYKKRL